SVGFAELAGPVGFAELAGPVGFAGLKVPGGKPRGESNFPARAKSVRSPAMQKFLEICMRIILKILSGIKSAK
ncbi:MAG: hypothetical protein ACLFN1_06745, partial [Bacteroidales bacterium]